VWHSGTNAVTGMCTKSTYVTAEDDGKIRTFLVRGSLEHPLAYFVKQHASKGPPRPTFSTITAQFCGREALPPDFFQGAAAGAAAAAVAGVAAGVVAGVAAGTSAAAAPTPRDGNFTIHKKRARAPPFAPPPPRRPPPARASTMRWQLADGRSSSNSVGACASAPVDTIVRPLLRDGVPQAYDVYIGHAWPRRRLAASPFAPPAGVPNYAAYAAARMRTDKGWARAVRALRGKVLACWCGGGCDCHGHVLLALANAQ
jgi:hypothetical protein